MSDSISGVIIPLIIPVDAPPSLASGVQALATSLEGTEFGNACLQLQQSFCYLTWHFADYSARHLQHLGLAHTPCSHFGHARLQQHLEALQKNLDMLAQVADQHPEVGDVFRVFYVGGLRARQTSPRRHTRLLDLGGQSIRGYRSILEWCKLEVGEEEFSGELRCQRELRRYLPILREWLDSSSGHFRQIKTMEWYSSAPTAETEAVEPTTQSPAAVAEASAPATDPPPAITAEALTGLKTPPSDLPAPPGPLSNYRTPPILWRHQFLFDEEAAHQQPSAYITLGRLSGLVIQYLFAISAAALRSAEHLDAALEKRLESGLTLRQKQTSLTFLFKALAQHQAENPLLEQVARAVHAPTGGKLTSWLTSTWGGGHTFAEFCLETAKPDPPPLWQERFLPGIRIWLQQTASWFAQAEHYFQPPNEQGFISFTVQIGDEHLEADRKALQIDTAALRIPIGDVAQLLSPLKSLETVELEPPPEPAPEPVAETVEPQPAPEPAPEPVAETVEPEPTPQLAPEPVAETVEPEPAPEPAPEPVAETVEPQPAPEPAPEPVAETVEPEPAPEPAPEPMAETVEPEPAPEPVPAPVAETVEPQPAPEPAPEPVAETVEPEPAPEPAPEPIAETVEPEPTPEPAPEPVAETVPLQSAEQEGWVGPDFALQLWDESLQTDQPMPLLRLISFLLQYTNGVAAEWQEIEARDVPHSISVALEQVRQRLTEPGDTQVLLALGSGEDPTSLSSWLHSQELAHWLEFERNPRADYQALARQWMMALQPFFQDSEQLFEEPSAQGTLEGVVVYQDRYLEFVDHPIHVGDLSSPFWQIPIAQTTSPVILEEGAEPSAIFALDDAAPLAELPPLDAEISTAGMTAVAEVAEGPPCDPDFSCLPLCVTEYYGDLWPAQGVSCEGLAAGLEFFIQYFAGLLTCAAIQEASLEASHLEAWRGDSNLLQRLDMLHQVLNETEDAEQTTLKCIRKIFCDSAFSQSWQNEWDNLASLAFSLRSGHSEEHQRAAQILYQWFEASRELLGTLENLAEPVDERGHLELVVQQDELFLELVEPEFAIHLVPPGFEHWQDLAIYRNLSAKYGSLELLGSSEGSQELSGGASAGDEMDDFFGGPAGDPQELLTSLFKTPETVTPEVPKPRPTLVQEPQETVEPLTRTELQLNAAMEKLLQQPVAAPEPAQPVISEEPEAGAEKPETKAPARLNAAPVTQPPVAEFIVVDPPILKHTIHYIAKEAQIHHGKIEIRNAGGSLLKGTVKSNHPCLRVSPSVFRSNEAEIEFWIDDGDRPSNMQKIGLSFHYSGQKLEVPMEKLLPDKKFKQLASKVMGFVKNFRQKH